MQVSSDVDECVECGFDIHAGSLFDAIRTVSHAREFVDLACESMPPALLDEYAVGGSSSIAEHIESVTELLRSTRQIVVPATKSDGDSGSLESVVEGLGFQAAAASTSFREFSEAKMGSGSPNAEREDQPAGLAIRQAAHAVLHLQAEIGRIRGLLGDRPNVGMGKVAQVSRSGGGLPKTPHLTAQIDKSGVVGDRQATRRHHGAPFQALCLFSAEVIDGFVAQGHPIAYGSAGENVTIRGLAWTELRAGLELRIGDVTCRLTAPAVPCSQNAPWFTDGDFSRLSHTKHPGQSRWYAAVVDGGTIRPDDGVHLVGND